MLNPLPLLRSLLPRPGAPMPAADADKAKTPALLEALERRLVPSATVATGDFNHNGLDDLNVKTNDPGAHVTVTEDGAAGTTTVAIDGNHDGRFDGANDFFQVFGEIFDGVKVKLSGNGDRLDYLLASDMADVQHSFNFKLGSATGNIVNFDAQGHGILDSNVSLRVNGGTGFNAVSATTDLVDHSTVLTSIAPSGPQNAVNVNFFGAVQNNALVQTNVLTGPGQNAGGNSIHINVFGEVNASELDVRADGSADASAAHDVINVQLAGAVTHGALLQAEANVYRGGDEAHVEVAQGTFAVLDHAAAFVTVHGNNGGGQLLSVNSDGLTGTIPIDASSKLDILIAGGNGSDQITSDFSSVDALRLDGEFVLLVSGNRGNDQINVGLANTSDSFGLYDVTLRGDENNDRFNVFIDDPSNGAVAYDSSDLGFPTGYAIVAGGSGFNTANVFGNVATFNIG